MQNKKAHDFQAANRDPGAHPTHTDALSYSLPINIPGSGLLLGGKRGDVVPKEAEQFAVGTNYGECYFRNIDDAAAAVEMLAPYHGLNIKRSEVRHALDLHGCFERFPLEVYKC